MKKNTQHIKDTIVSTIIASMVANDFLIQIKSTPYYKQSVKNAVNKNINILDTAFKTEIEKFDKIGYEQLTFFYNELYLSTQSIAKVPILNWQKLRILIEAFLIDEKRLMRIAKKIIEKHENELKK